MSLQVWTILLPYILSALISLLISVYVYLRGRIPGAGPFARLALLECIWTAGYIFQIISPDLPAKLIWNNIQFLGAVFSPLAFFCFGVEFAGLSSPRLSRLRLPASLLAGALLALIWTDGWHHLFRTAPHLVLAPPFSRLVFTDGPAFFLFPLLGYSVLVLGTFALVKNLIAAPRIYRQQALAVLAGILIPWIATLLTWLRLVPVPLHDVVPLTFAFSNLIVAWALSRYRLFDLVPVAYDVLLDHMEDGLLVLDEQERIMDLNRAARQILDLSFREAVGLAFPSAHPAFAGLIQPEMTGQPVEVILKVNCRDRFFEVRLMKLDESRRPARGWLVLLRDMTEFKEHEERLHRLAITDPLTEIYNRRQFFSLAEVELKRAARSRRPFAVLLLDIDHFKAVNDRFGHITGDQVLQQAVTRFQQHLRPYDIIARYGGDEFVILLPETELPTAYEIAGRLRRCMSASAFVTQSGPVAVTTSIGAAVYDPAAHLSIDSLVDCADQALYDAKQQGRNCVCAWGQLAPIRLPANLD